ncbi:hypothetical protein QO034_20430 [Sedimentitalea sp. JM2-8]|uniref:Uncharacterized protein n=1 Tax=Sedimentitalea xiamensis TaxID=3050037 RepID=A0ABT7FJX6_9RHOB|nr:hypothetical protein [Sedimentitalea xiamensis]MDK3075446.1 hypothetical protein [Sedimentitalea xiamensis]
MKKQDHPSQRQIDLLEIEGQVHCLANNVLTALRLAWHQAMEAPRNERPHNEACVFDNLEYLTSKAIEDMQELMAQLGTAHEIKREAA